MKTSINKELKVGLLFILLISIVATITFSAIGCQKTEEEKSEKKKEKKVEKPKELILATTTSTKDTGLLDEIIPDFEKEYNYKVKVVAVGTGEALSMGERGEADVLLVHARTSEDEFMEAGYGKIREDVMYNDFVFLGSASDPAGVKDTKSIDALNKISQAKANFVTRGDDSGTHKKESKLWDKAKVKPSGEWYISTGQGMGASLQIASEKQAYILSDRATFLSQEDSLNLQIVVEKEEDLFNPYGVIAVNWEKYPKVNKEGAEEFMSWLTSVETQEKIGEFGKDEYGQALFTPDSKEWNKENK